MALVFIAIFFLLNITNSSNGYTPCEPFICGNVSKENLTYPYWNGKQSAECGHPAYKLNCDEDPVTLDMNSEKFVVLEINQETGILKIVPIHIFEFNGTCPKEYKNASLDSKFFNYALRDGQFNLFYDCGNRPLMSPLNHIPYTNYRCDADDGLCYGYLVSTNNFVYFTKLGCKKNIVLHPSFVK